MKEVLPGKSRKAVKQRYNLMFYPSDVRRFDAAAQRFNVSRSELLLFVFDYADSQLALSATSGDRTDAE